jgi:hypothetical protein
LEQEVASEMVMVEFQMVEGLPGKESNQKPVTAEPLILILWIVELIILEFVAVQLMILESLIVEFVTVAAVKEWGPMTPSLLALYALIEESQQPDLPVRVGLWPEHQIV